MGYRPGECAGPYQIVRLLGRGTFGEVFLARDPRRGNRPVALKAIACDRIDGAEQTRESALAEAQLMRRFRHPHIVGCEEVEFDPQRNCVWFALEFMDGGDVQTLLDARRKEQELSILPFEGHFMRRVLAAVGSALRYIHSDGVLHRDVKPANILLTRSSQRIKLADFGVSKLLEATGDRARTVVGTPYYLSPEVVSGQAYGSPADAWALGVCLYELATLRRPFEAGNPLALVRRICEEPVAQMRPETPGDISAAIHGLLEKDQHRRMTLSSALGVSDAVEVLAAASPAQSDDHSHDSSGHSQGDACGALSPEHGQNGLENELLSPVSVATSEGSVYMTDEAEIMASLCGRPPARYAPPAPPPPPPPPPPVQVMPNTTTATHWRECEAITQARAALSAEVDDPEELKDALLALEQEEAPAAQGLGASAAASAPKAEAVQALSAELRLRVDALRADAAAMIESLLDPAPPTGGEDSPDADGIAQLPSVCTQLAIGEPSFDRSDLGGGCDNAAALETAIELATSLGVDTGPAEARAACARGMLSVRVTWGSSARFLLLPLGGQFRDLTLEVVRRFSVGGQHSHGEGVPHLEFLCLRGGCFDGVAATANGESLLVRDQASWEACLRRCGLVGRTGRLEFRVEKHGAAAVSNACLSARGHGAAPVSGRSSPGPQASAACRPRSATIWPPPRVSARTRQSGTVASAGRSRQQQPQQPQPPPVGALKAAIRGGGGGGAMPPAGACDAGGPSRPTVVSSCAAQPAAPRQQHQPVGRVLRPVPTPCNVGAAPHCYVAPRQRRRLSGKAGAVAVPIITAHPLSSASGGVAPPPPPGWR
eukprot:TRINITY_DN58281_c1_g1_i1.p1 TRINITY_DN58281_c1_g1~~TRINITY_DN58281_c1_g1_i1.p1  ORF type:complete len:829 (+),score=157.96 TRINITY_DN58281_c1_g1_i1:213-2699(+)